MIQKRIYEHQSEQRLFTKEEIKNIVESYPETIYQGKAYRVLLLNKENKTPVNVDEDICFTNSLNSVSYFLSKEIGREIDDQYIQLFEVNIIGIKLKDLVKKLGIDLSQEPAYLHHHFHDSIESENEILNHKVLDQYILYSGAYKDFDINNFN